MRNTLALLTSAAIVSFAIGSTAIAASADSTTSGGAAVSGSVSTDPLKLNATGSASGQTDTAANTNSGTMSTSGTASGSTSGSLTLQQINPSQPFGELPIKSDSKADQASMASLSAEQNAELKERCQLITGNPSGFDQQAVAYCSDYMKLEMNKTQ